MAAHAKPVLVHRVPVYAIAKGRVPAPLVNARPQKSVQLVLAKLLAHRRIALKTVLAWPVLVNRVPVNAMPMARVPTPLVTVHRDKLA